MTRWKPWDWHTERVPGDAPPTKQQQVVAHVAARIRSGELQPGQRIDSIETTAEKLGFSKNTVIEAYRELVALGLVSAEPGSGHRVTGVDGGSLAARVARLEAGYAELREAAGLDPMPPV